MNKEFCLKTVIALFVLVVLCGDMFGQEFALRSRDFSDMFDPKYDRPKISKPVVVETIAVPRMSLERPKSDEAPSIALAYALERKPEPLPLVFRDLKYVSEKWDGIVIDQFGWLVALGEKGKVSLVLPACESLSPACKPTVRVGVAFRWNLR